MRELYQPWSAEKAAQRWPFRAGATLALPDGRVVEKDLFTSLHLLVPTVDVWISAFGRWGSGYFVEVSSENGHILTGLEAPGWAADLTLQFMPVDEANEIIEAGSFGGAARKGTPLGIGQVNSEDGINWIGIPYGGRVEVSRDAFPVDPECLLILPRNYGATIAGKRMSGVVWVIAGDGVIFSRARSGDDDYPGVRVSVQGVSSREQQRLACEAAGVAAPEDEPALYPLRSVNGVSPDAQGRLGLRLKTPGEGGTLGTALRLKSSGSGHTFFLAGAS